MLTELKGVDRTYPLYGTLTADGRPVGGIIRTVKPLVGSINFAAGVQAQGIYTPTANETIGLAAEVA